MSAKCIYSQEVHSLVTLPKKYTRTLTFVKFAREEDRERERTQKRASERERLLELARELELFKEQVHKFEEEEKVRKMEKEEQAAKEAAGAAREANRYIDACKRVVKRMLHQQLAASWSLFCESVEQSKANRETVDKVLKKRVSHRSLALALECYAAAAGVIITQREKVEKMIARLRSKRLTKAFEAWVAYVGEIKDEQAKETVMMTNKLLKDAASNAAAQGAQQAKATEAANRRLDTCKHVVQRIVLRLHLTSAWAFFKERICTSKRRYERSLALAFQGYSEVVSTLILQRQKVAKAVAGWTTPGLIKAFEAWEEYVDITRQKQAKELAQDRLRLESESEVSRFEEALARFEGGLGSLQAKLSSLEADLSATRAQKEQLQSVLDTVITEKLELLDLITSGVAHENQNTTMRDELEEQLRVIRSQARECETRRELEHAEVVRNLEVQWEEDRVMEEEAAREQAQALATEIASMWMEVEGVCVALDAIQSVVVRWWTELLARREEERGRDEKQRQESLRRGLVVLEEAKERARMDEIQRLERERERTDWQRMCAVVDEVRQGREADRREHRREREREGVVVQELRLKLLAAAGAAEGAAREREGERESERVEREREREEAKRTQEEREGTTLSVIREAITGMKQDEFVLSSTLFLLNSARHSLGGEGEGTDRHMSAEVRLREREGRAMLGGGGGGGEGEEGEGEAGAGAEGVILRGLRHARVGGAVAVVGHVGISEGKWIMFAGGTDGVHVRADCDIFDCSRQSWRPAAAMRQPRVSLQLVSLGGFVYAIGGEDEKGQVLASVERYDAVADRWTLVRPLRTRRTGASCCVLPLAVPPAILVAGGWDGEAHLNSIEYWPPSFHEPLSLSLSLSQPPIVEPSDLHPNDFLLPPLARHSTGGRGEGQVSERQSFLKSVVNGGFEYSSAGPWRGEGQDTGRGEGEAGAGAGAGAEAGGGGVAAAAVLFLEEWRRHHEKAGALCQAVKDEVEEQRVSVVVAKWKWMVFNVLWWEREREREEEIEAPILIRPLCSDSV